ncbi:unnamed protein product, partial [Aureobasidium uvarum]
MSAARHGFELQSGSLDRDFRHPLYRAIGKKKFERYDTADRGSTIPINYVTAPGVELTPVCFSDRLYEDAAAQQCLSNLLALGFHRIIVDLYWDQSRQTWSLCPVELSTQGNSTSPINTGGYPSSLSTSSSSTSPSAILTRARFSGDTAEPLERQALRSSSIIVDEDVHQRAQIHVRQTSELLSESTDASATNAALTAATITTDSSSSGGSVVAISQTFSAAQPSQTGHQIGGYSCTESIGISTITSVLADYFQTTENDLNATFKYLEFNVRLAAPFNDPADTTSSADPERLPTLGNYISDLINSTLSRYLYTPAALRSERANLNQSWLAGDIENPPAVEYMTTMPLNNGSGLYTLDGWPSESIIMFLRALRIIASVRLDSQMQQYDFSADAETIFPAESISNNVGTTLSSDGTVTNGCLYQPGNTTLAAVNSSWAISSNLPNTTSLNTTNYAALNISSCGISPVLNTSLLGSLATNNATTYRQFTRGSLWGWDTDEPSDNSSFAVPRTALENRYMIAALRDWVSRQTDFDDAPVFWLSINDIDTKDCWVSGVDQTCPYRSDARDTGKPTVVIPTVAGVIVFLLAILTIFVKCAANRQNTRRRLKRGEGGWDYEGVPS